MRKSTLASCSTTFGSCCRSQSTASAYRWVVRRYSTSAKISFDDLASHLLGKLVAHSEFGEQPKCLLAVLQELTARHRLTMLRGRGWGHALSRCAVRLALGIAPAVVGAWNGAVALRRLFRGRQP